MKMMPVKRSDCAESRNSWTFMSKPVRGAERKIRTAQDSLNIQVGRNLGRCGKDHVVIPSSPGVSIMRMITKSKKIAIIHAMLALDCSRAERTALSK
jgi:hypothetical protein